MKKIIISMLVMCIFLTNTTGITYAYETKSIISNSTYVVSEKIDNATYKGYETKIAMGSAPKGTVFIVDSKGKIVTSTTIIKKFLTLRTEKGSGIKAEVNKQKKLYEERISVTKKLKSCISFVKFQEQVIKTGLNAGKNLVDDISKLSETEFKKKFDPRAQLVKFATSELQAGVKEYDKFLKLKINSYDDSKKGLEYLEKAASYSPAITIINEWIAKVDKNISGVTTKDYISVITGGWSDKIGNFFENGIKSAIGKIVSSAKTAISKAFNSSTITTSLKNARDKMKKAKDYKKKLEEVQSYVKNEYKKIEPYAKYVENKNKIAKSKYLFGRIDVNANNFLAQTKKIDAYAQLNVFSQFTVNSVKASHTTITGKGTSGATIKAYLRGKQVGKTVTVDSKGNYKISIAKKKVGEKLVVKMSKSKYREVEKTITVSK